MDRLDPMSYLCPRCKAKPDQPCMSVPYSVVFASGRREMGHTRAPHDERRIKADMAARTKPPTRGNNPFTGPRGY